MGERGNRYTLEGMIEMDEKYFTTEASKQEHETQKAGRGSKNKTNVMIKTESTILEYIETEKVDRQCRYFKAKVLTDPKTDITQDTFEKTIYEQHTIDFKNKSTKYILNIADYVEINIPEKSNE